MCDDFDDSGDEATIRDRSWQKQIDGVSKDGYRTGIEVGQEESLQKGFDVAFTCSGQTVAGVAKLRGKISGKLAYNLMKPGFLSEDQRSRLENLLGDILQLESELLTFNNDSYNQLSLLTVSSTYANNEGAKADETAGCAGSSAASCGPQENVATFNNPSTDLGDKNVATSSNTLSTNQGCNETGSCKTNCCQNAGKKCCRSIENIDCSDGDKSFCTYSSGNTGGQDEQKTCSCKCNRSENKAEELDNKLQEVPSKGSDTDGQEIGNSASKMEVSSVEKQDETHISVPQGPFGTSGNIGSVNKLWDLQRKFHEIMSIGRFY